FALRAAPLHAAPQLHEHLSVRHGRSVMSVTLNRVRSRRQGESAAPRRARPVVGPPAEPVARLMPLDLVIHTLADAVRIREHRHVVADVVAAEDEPDPAPAARAALGVHVFGLHVDGARGGVHGGRRAGGAAERQDAQREQERERGGEADHFGHVTRTLVSPAMNPWRSCSAMHAWCWTIASGSPAHPHPHAPQRRTGSPVGWTIGVVNAHPASSSATANARIMWWSSPWRSRTRGRPAGRARSGHGPVAKRRAVRPSRR